MAEMSDMKSRSLGRKNKKGLALSAPPQKSPAPSSQDAQIPGAIGNSVNDPGTLEIGVEFKLDLRNEDLKVLKELGAGNGGTVSKVMHTATLVIMAKKVKITLLSAHIVQAQRVPDNPRGEISRSSKEDCARATHHA